MPITTYFIHDGDGERMDAATDADRADQLSRDGYRVTAVTTGRLA